MFANRLVTKHVHTREHPAATGRLLVGDGFGRHCVRHMGVKSGIVVVVHRQLADIIAVDSVTQGLVGRISLKRSAKRAYLLHGQSTIFRDVLRLDGQHTSSRTHEKE